MQVDTTWLTVNRTCNLACEWCYAKEALDNSEMDIKLAKKLIDISIKAGVKSFLLIGGEPTIYPHLVEILKYLISYDARVVIVTNGIALQNTAFCDMIKNLKYEKIHFGISLKGISEDEYLEKCGAKGYLAVLKGLKNCEERGLDYSISYVISLDNVGDLLEFGKEMKRSNISKPIFFEICNDLLIEDAQEGREEKVLLEIDTKFAEVYAELSEILDDKIRFHQAFPLCMVNQDIFRKMKGKNQVMTSCHVQRRNGLIFDVDGSLLLCNHFAGYSFGEFGVDYQDFESLKTYWDSDYAVNLHKNFTTMPSMKCMNCELSEECGGGCCFQWFSQKFENYCNYVQKSL